MVERVCYVRICDECGKIDIGISPKAPKEFRKIKRVPMWKWDKKHYCKDCFQKFLRGLK